MTALELEVSLLVGLLQAQSPFPTVGRDRLAPCLLLPPLLLVRGRQLVLVQPVLAVQVPVPLVTAAVPVVVLPVLVVQVPAPPVKEVVLVSAVVAPTEGC